MQCDAIRIDGQPCRAPAVRGGTKCFWHSKRHERVRKEASAAGGRSKQLIIQVPECDPLSAKQARAILTGVLDGLLSGALPTDAARTAGYILQIEGKLRSDGELEERLSALEDNLNQQTGDSDG